MPLTLVHPVAALPLQRLGLPVAGLVVGSMVPDVEYMLRLMPVSRVSHTPLGLATFCLPVGLLVLALWELVWRRPLCAAVGLAPRPARVAMPPAGRLIGLGLAVLAGATTHVLWDSFTHSHGWMVRHLALLSMPLVDTRWGPVALCRVLQHASSLLGFMVLALIAVRRGWRVPGFTSIARRMGLVAAGVSAAAGLLYGLLRAGPPVDVRAVQRLAGFGAVGFFTMGAVAVTAMCLAWHFFLKRFERSPVYMSGGLKE